MMDNARFSQQPVANIPNPTYSINTGMNKPSEVDSQIKETATTTSRRKNLLQKKQGRVHTTKNTSMKNGLAPLIYELRLLRQENRYTRALLQQAFKVSQPADNHLRTVDGHSIPKHFVDYNGRRHQTDFLTRLDMDEERYGRIKESYTGLFYGLKMQRYAGVHQMRNDPLSQNNIKRCIFSRYRRKMLEYNTTSELKEAWPPFELYRDSESSLNPIHTYRHLVELHSKTSSTIIASSSERVPIGFVFEYSNTLLQWNRFGPPNYFDHVPLHFALIAEIVGLLTPPRAKPRNAEPQDFESHDTESRQSQNDEYTDSDENIENGSCPSIFLTGYFQTWKSLKANINVRQMNPGILWCGYRVRCFTSRPICEDRKGRHRWEFGDGIIPDREGGEIFGRNVPPDFWLTERRFCLYLICPREANWGSQYLVVRVFDEGNIEPKHDNDNDAWQKFELRNCLRWAGVVSFQLSICRILQEWQDEWLGLLEKIDEIVSIKSTDVLKRELRRGLMYDDEQLSQSEIYFSLLQLLRVFDETITQGERDLQLLADTCCSILEINLRHFHEDDEGEAAAVSIVAENWKMITSSHTKRTRELLERMSRKTEDLKSLRDGLFNTQSVRETTKGARVNQYILIFTVVTILYLPPTFAATFFGMHLFDGENGPTEWTQKTFWKVFGGVTGLTYTVAAVALLGVRKRRTVTMWRFKSLSLHETIWHFLWVLWRWTKWGMRLFKSVWFKLHGYVHHGKAGAEAV
ncbi:hypothetical protein F5Y14DRAFT_415315 [Nemania sp. NC0429]|nr:hypothetical protein F5Y14DRAFT_415315 [Nemania sp. NC0429]